MTRDKEPAPAWIDRHSVNCAVCGELADERNCARYINDEGSICPPCMELIAAAPKLLEGCKGILPFAENTPLGSHTTPGTGREWTREEAIQFVREAVRQAGG